jgi:hypothetical protein
MVRRCSFALCALALSCLGLCANPGDVENAQDYPGFVRPAGFIITDYDEDNPAEAEFPIAKPLPLDSDHVEQTHVRGHRYVIRYEIAEGNAPSIYQMQTYYEKVAKEAGFDVAKNGGIGDVSETFVRTSSAKDVWISLVPSGGTNVLTVVEVAHAGTSGPSESELRLVAAPATVARPADTKLPAPHRKACSVRRARPHPARRNRRNATRRNCSTPRSARTAAPSSRSSSGPAGSSSMARRNRWSMPLSR